CRRPCLPPSRFRPARESRFRLHSLAPALFADQRHEAHPAEIFFLQDSVFLLRDLDEFLHAIGIADGHDDPSVGGELLDQRPRNVASGGGGEDRTKRRLVAPALRAVTLDDLDIVITEAPHSLASDRDQLGLPLDPDHLGGDAADHRRGVTRTGSHLEHLFARCDTRRLDHQRDDIGLRDRLPRLDRNRMVAIGEMGMLFVDEFLARNREKRVEDRLFRDSAPPELALDHLLAVGFEVCHCDGHWSTSGLSENPPAREAVPQMTSTDTDFAGSIPGLYDRYMGPLLFLPYADEVARRARSFAPRDIVETAAGTGLVTAALHSALPDAAIVATDLNPAMLAVAAEHIRSDKVRFEPADALALPFAEGSFDLVVCQFGLMFFPDKVKGNAEARRILREGGHYIAVIW